MELINKTPSTEFPLPTKRPHAISVPQIGPVPKYLKRKNKKRTPTFPIFEDTSSDEPTFINAKSSKKSGLKAGNSKVRTPLGVRKETSNFYRTSSPRDPSTPFVLNIMDPFWEDKENYVPHTPYTPVHPAQQRNKKRCGSQTSIIHTPSKRYSLYNNFRVSENVAVGGNSVLEGMVLYQMLGIDDKKAYAHEIKMAFLKAARESHPDRVFGDKAREVEATIKMQRLLAARNVLLDDTRRRKYDADGVLPRSWPAESPERAD